MKASTTAVKPIGKPIAPAHLDALKALVGPGGFLEGDADTHPYRRAWRYSYEGKTPLVLRPKSTAEVQALVQYCAAHGVPMVPQGGNTGLTFGGVPHETMSEVVITTERLNAVRGIDLGNDTITVESGVVLQTIQEAAVKANRLFPLSLGAQGSCRIGGNISTNAGGVNVLRYGNTRSLVLGLEVVLPDGRVWDGLRGLRKDNTGYDLKHLFIGGEGTLGIITAAVLRLFPLPTASETAWIAVESPAKGVALLGRMKERMGDAISAFELLSRSIVEFTIAGVPGNEDPMREVHPWYVLMDVTSQGAPGSLHESLSEGLAAAAEDGLIIDAVITGSLQQAKKLWKMREDMAEGQRSAGGSIGHDISVPVSEIATFVAEADAAMEAAYPGIRHCCFGHVGDGNLHYNPVRPLGWTQERFMEDYDAVNRIVHDIVIKHRGSISAEHGIGRIRLAENHHYKSDVEIDLMRAVKRALDPANLMNPGKLVQL
jgi:FAD/FMN-containing dehydrogenase